jgi:hypothetical protein
MSAEDPEAQDSGPGGAAAGPGAEATGPGAEAGGPGAEAAGPAAEAGGTGARAAGVAGGRGARRRRGPILIASTGSFVLHGLAVLWLWHSWRRFGRGGVLAWIDFPSSLAFLRLRGGARLVWSVLAGGAQWALLGAGLSLLVGSSARQAPAPGEPDKPNPS